MHFGHFYVAKAIYALLAHFCRKSNLPAMSGKFLRVIFCRLESFAGGRGVHQLILSPQVGHHPELRAQQLQHLLERGLQVSTSVLISQGRLQLVQDQRTLSLRGCSRVARQAPMWVVVRPAWSEKKATCWPWGSGKMQQGGA